MTKTLGSSVGKKIMMAFAGLFLITFLVVHLIINSLLVFSDTEETFNIAANFMGTNPAIKVMEIILFAGFLVHIIWGIVLQIQNWRSRPTGYKVSTGSYTSPFSRYMIHTAIIILIFLGIHLADFYFVAKFVPHGVPEVSYGDQTVHNLAELVIAKFQMPAYVIGYIVAFLLLGFHLYHGFQSAFQTIGLNHKSYFPVIKAVGIIYSIVIFAGFTIIPLLIYFQ